MTDNQTFTRKIKDFEATGNLLYKKSIEIIHASIDNHGATTASLHQTRYAQFCYPRDHAYTTRAFINIGELHKALKAIIFILQCEMTTDGTLYQRYNTKGFNASYKPPQIDGNAQTLISIANYISTARSLDALTPYQRQIIQLISGILNQKHAFPNGSLIYSLNGIIEFTAFEKGYELYTNAVCYRALYLMSFYPSLIGDTLAQKIAATAAEIKKGIAFYLFSNTNKTFFSCLRDEPDISYVTLPNLKSYLALSDFDVFLENPKSVKNGLSYHLKGTKNNELGGYNRYHELMGRHNFGNGPWPMVMLRLASYYRKMKQITKAQNCINWVINVAKSNVDIPFGLPEHVASQQAFDEAYQQFLINDDTAPRQAKRREYVTILQSKTLQSLHLAYAVNPLVWSHAQFILTWNELHSNIPSHTH